MEQKKKVMKTNAVRKATTNTKTELFEKRVNLEKAIEEKKLSFEELGALVGCSGRNIGYYVSGRSKTIPSDMLLKLSEVLSVSPDYILGKIDQPDYDLFLAISKDATAKTLSRYRTVFNLLDDIGIKFSYIEEENALYMEPDNHEPIYINDDMYWFFVKHIRKYAYDIFMEYYNSVHAYKNRMQHAREKGGDTDEIE